MPPKSPQGTVMAEDALAERVRLERERRGWSPAGLASRMTSAGCPMTQSAIWKIENGEPRRRITFDEAVSFAKVFEISLDELTLPPHVLAAEQTVDAVRGVAHRFDAIYDQVGHINADLAVIRGALQADESGLVARAFMRAVVVGEESETLHWSVASRDERLQLAQRGGGDADQASVWLREAESVLASLDPFLRKVHGDG